jgi:Protein of unknown function (DUF1236)
MTKSLQVFVAMAVSTALALATASAQTPAEPSPRNLSLEQQAKIANVITREAGAPGREAHFSLAIGNTVPADLQLRPVPASVAQVAPQFRGASYLVVEEQIALVDTQTRKILAVIQRGLSQTTGSAQSR